MKQPLHSLGMFVAMLLSSLLILLGVALLCVAALRVTDRLTAGPQRQPLAVQADYPLCVTVKPPPIHPQKRENGAAPVADLA